MSTSLLSRAVRSAVIAATACAVTVAAAPAQAAAGVLPGSFLIEVVPADNGGATATLADTLVSPTDNYTVLLTATGAGTCAFASPQVLIADTASGYGNPVTVQTSGACRLYNAEVTYTFTWTPIFGATGQLQVVCVWTLGTKTCTPGRFEGRIPV